MIASTIAPIVGGVIRDIASSYRYVILSSAISSSVALLSLAILLQLYKKKNKLWIIEQCALQFLWNQPVTTIV